MFDREPSRGQKVDVMRPLLSVVNAAASGDDTPVPRRLLATAVCALARVRPCGDHPVSDHASSVLDVQTN